jgi:CRISPR associated protein, Cas1 family
MAQNGLDPGLGVGLHTDTGNRNSLALDVLEAVRPQIETWVLNWIASEPLRRVPRIFLLVRGPIHGARQLDSGRGWGTNSSPLSNPVKPGMG